jgi:hypothetical protein
VKVRVVLTVIGGAIVGVLLGYAIGVATAELLVCRAGTDRCRTARTVFSFLGIPFGAVAGALLAVLVGKRRAG